MASTRELALKALETRDRLLLSKTLTRIEEGEYSDIVDILFAHEPRSHIVGITGAPGVGKSSLINRLIKELRKRGRSVAVVAIDPSSPISGGSFMGNRIRVRYFDENTFFRSISTHPERALPLSALLMIEFLDAMKYDYIIIETPGVGQINVDVRCLAHTTVVVLQPLTGDEIQALKSGIMEIGDIYVVNKADMPQSEITAMQLEVIFRDVEHDGWRVRIVKTCTYTGSGVPELVDAIEAHWDHLQRTRLVEQKLLRRRVLVARRFLEEAYIDNLLKTLESEAEHAPSQAISNPIEFAKRAFRAWLESLENSF